MDIPANYKKAIADYRKKGDDVKVQDIISQHEVDPYLFYAYLKDAGAFRNLTWKLTEEQKRRVLTNVLDKKMSHQRAADRAGVSRQLVSRMVAARLSQIEDDPPQSSDEDASA